MSALYISAAHKSSGKTILTLGLCAAFRQRGLSVQTFKKGPDYIDPIWLGLASGKACHNLDFYTSTPEYSLSQYQRYSSGSDVVLVEGNKGLHDGVALDGSDSNAAMARLLELPVILVLDTVGSTRGIAPLLLGYQNFDKQVRIAGVILNKVGGARHSGKLINAIETYTDIPVLGSVARDQSMQLAERHLGLVPCNEMAQQAQAFVENLGERVANEVDLEQILQSPRGPSATVRPLVSEIPSRAKLRIAIARDRSFGFYYPADLQRFADLGVSLVDFDTSRDSALPEHIDGLFIGGGFPETNLDSISSNVSLLSDIKENIENGLPAYAECGGLMYLCRSIEYQQHRVAMAGVIAADVIMHSKPQGRGYLNIAPTPQHPWYSESAPAPIQAHEFHYSRLENIDTDTRYAYKVKRGSGIDGTSDGIIKHNLLASYGHLRQTDTCNWVDRFVDFIHRCKANQLNDYDKQECRRAN